MPTLLNEVLKVFLSYDIADDKKTANGRALFDHVIETGNALHFQGLIFSLCAQAADEETAGKGSAKEIMALDDSIIHAIHKAAKAHKSTKLEYKSEQEITEIINGLPENYTKEQLTTGINQCFK